MINGERVIAIIPARGGSKSVPYKNIKMIAGKPLIAWTIEIAKKVVEFDKIIVSTEDEKIAEIARVYGADVMIRPFELAQDDSLVIETIRDVIFKLQCKKEEFDIVVLLEPTSPLRSIDDIRSCLQLLTATGNKVDSVATFSEASLHPHRAWRITDNTPKTFIEGAIPWLPRQKLSGAYQLNGAVYAVRLSQIYNGISLLTGNTGSIVMPKERSVDIDDEIDFMIVDELMKKGDRCNEDHC